MDTKKILASIAAAAMLGGAVPMTVSAAPEEETPVSSDSAVSDEETTSAEGETSPDGEIEFPTEPATEEEELGFHFKAKAINGGTGIEIFGFSDSTDDGIIPEEVSGIPVVKISKLEGTGSIKKLVIPASVEHIAKNAFNDIEGLESIEVSEENENYASVDGVLFDKEMTRLILCPALNNIKSITIPDTVVEVDKGAIVGVESLEEIKIGAGITAVDSSLFSECPNIKYVSVSDGAEIIDYNYIKAKTSIAGYEISENNAFYASVDGALYNKEMTVLYSLPVGKLSSTFQIPATVTDIAENAFEGCTELSSIIAASGENEAFTVVDGFLYNKDMTALIKCPSKSAPAEFVIPDSVQTIADNAFEDCASLKKVTIGKNLHTLKGDPFSGSTAVEEFSGSSESLITKDGVIYNAMYDTIVKYPAGKADSEVSLPSFIISIDFNAFANCKNIKAYNAAEDSQVFSTADGILFNKEGTRIIKYPSASENEEYTVQANVQAIDGGAFQSAKNLKTVTVMNCETTVGNAAFRGMAKGFVLCGNKDSCAKEYADRNFMNFSAFEGDYSRGDVNNDGVVNAIDASNILKEYANIATEAELTFSEQQNYAGDISADGELNSIDASYVLAYYAYTATTSDEPVLSVRAYIKQMLEKLEEENNAAEEKTYDEVSSSVAVAEYLFEQLDAEAVNVGDIIDSEKLAELAGEDSEVVAAAHSYVAPDLSNMTGSDLFNAEYILSVLPEDSEYREIFTVEGKLDELSEEEIKDLYMALDEIEEFDKEQAFKPEAAAAILESMLGGYDFVYAYILDENTIIIDNGTGMLLSVGGVIVTRNDAVPADKITVPEELGYDGDMISVSEKTEGYENVFSWYAGT